MAHTSPWTDCEAARIRGTTLVAANDMSPLTKFFITKKNRLLGAEFLPLSVLVAYGRRQALLRYAQRAVAFGASHPSPYSYMIAAAVDGGRDVPAVLKAQPSCAAGIAAGRHPADARRQPRWSS